MPTAHQFDLAARTFDGVAEDLDTLLAATPGHLGPDTLSGGTLTLVAELTISTVIATASSAGQLVRDLADTCRRRAAVCRTHAAEIVAYESALRHFEASGSPASARPTRPRRPASWVEV